MEEFKCNKCNSDNISYDNIFKERFDDLKPLCRNCHEKQHL